MPHNGPLKDKTMNKKPTAEETLESPQIENLKAYIFKPYELTVYQKALAISEFNKLMAYTKTLEEAHANNAVEEMCSEIDCDYTFVEGDWYHEDDLEGENPLKTSQLLKILLTNKD